MLDRILHRVGSVRPARLLASALLYPFYLAGWLAGIVVVFVVLLGAAVGQGFADARSRSAA